MPVPQFLSDLLQLLLDLAVPAAFCTLAAAGVSLRHEGGTNFQGKRQNWTLGFMVCDFADTTADSLVDCGAGHHRSVGERFGGNELACQHGVGLQELREPDCFAKLVPVLAGYFVLKATLDTAAGENPLASIIAALFLMTLSATMQLFESWNDGGQYATTDMLGSLWNYIVGQIMPAAAGLACVGAVINYVRHRPWTRPCLFSDRVSRRDRLLKLFQAMAA